MCADIICITQITLKEIDNFLLIENWRFRFLSCKLVYDLVACKDSMYFGVISRLRSLRGSRNLSHGKTSFEFPKTKHVSHFRENPGELVIFQNDHFEILATGRSDMHCKIKESLLIRDLKPALNEDVGSEKLYLYY